MIRHSATPSTAPARPVPKHRVEGVRLVSMTSTETSFAECVDQWYLRDHSMGCIDTECPRHDPAEYAKYALHRADRP